MKEIVKKIHISGYEFVIYIGKAGDFHDDGTIHNPELNIMLGKIIFDSNTNFTKRAPLKNDKVKQIEEFINRAKHTVRGYLERVKHVHVTIASLEITDSLDQ